MSVLEAHDITSTAEAGELFAGYTAYTVPEEISTELGEREAVAATPTIISVTTILLTCLC